MIDFPQRMDPYSVSFDVSVLDLDFLLLEELCQWSLRPLIWNEEGRKFSSLSDAAFSGLTVIFFGNRLVENLIMHQEAWSIPVVLLWNYGLHLPAKVITAEVSI